MGNLTTALVFVMIINVFMFLAQATMLEINPEAILFFTNEGQILDSFDKNSGNGEPVLDTETTYSNLPAGGSSISPTTGQDYTDTFKTSRGWFGDKRGLDYLGAIVSAPYNFMKTINLPNAFVFAMGTLWYGITFFLLVAFVLGRDT